MPLFCCYGLFCCHSDTFFISRWSTRISFHNGCCRNYNFKRACATAWSCLHNFTFYCILTKLSLLLCLVKPLFWMFKQKNPAQLVAPLIANGEYKNWKRLQHENVKVILRLWVEIVLEFTLVFKISRNIFILPNIFSCTPQTLYCSMHDLIKNETK